MAKNDFLGWPEVFEAERLSRRHRAAYVASGELRRIRPGIYTTNLTDPLESVVSRNLWQIIGIVCPNAVISHRTALEMRPTPGGTIFVTGPYDRVISDLSGLKVRQIQGPGPFESDSRFVHNLSIASQSRALLECMSGVARGTQSPFIPRIEVESYLERILVSGEDRLNQTRDEARAISVALNAAEEFNELNAMIGALLGTRKSKLLSAKARGRTDAVPYDSDRIALFQSLLEELVAWPAPDRPDSTHAGPEFVNIAFFDAYFSNYIEGTRFEVDEAIDIVFNNQLPRARPEDAHDVLGTYRIVSNTKEMTRAITSLSEDEFLHLLLNWHLSIMGARQDKRPGKFKEVQNVAGNTRFVKPNLVQGTLRQGFQMAKGIRSPFGRAAFLMFLVAEVHPFDDGNGRIARAVMNAELVASGQRRILIPTVFRIEYIDALKRLSIEGQPRLFARMLDAAQEFSFDVEFHTLDRARAELSEWNAFDMDLDSRLRRRSR